jgi:hypothetical protein
MNNHKPGKRNLRKHRIKSYSQCGTTEVKVNKSSGLCEDCEFEMKGR